MLLIIAAPIACFYSHPGMHGTGDIRVQKKSFKKLADTKITKNNYYYGLKQASNQ
jgi:hypothetical protein